MTSLPGVICPRDTVRCAGQRAKFMRRLTAMTERPEPPPWGALITAALARQDLSAREAARRAGLSEGRWRQITAGYQVVSPGVYAQVHGPASTVARMAAVAGVTPAQLRTAGRA